MSEFPFKKFLKIEFSLEMLAFALVVIGTIFYSTNKDKAIENVKNSNAESEAAFPTNTIVTSTSKASVREAETSKSTATIIDESEKRRSENELARPTTKFLDNIPRELERAGFQASQTEVVVSNLKKHLKNPYPMAINTAIEESVMALSL